MGFVMDGLDAEDYDREYRDRDLAWRIFGYFKPEGRRMAVVAGAILASAGLDTALPVVISRTIDTLGANTARVSAEPLMISAAIISGLAALSWAFNWARQQLSAVSVGNVALRLRQDAFDAAVARDLSFYDQFPSGKIVSRITSDTQSFSTVVTLTMDLMSRIVLVFLLLGYLFTVDVTLTLILLGLSPLIIGTALAFRKVARNAVTQSRRAIADVSAHIQETVSGIAVAKTFRQEQAIYGEFLKVNETAFWLNFRTGMIFSGIFPILNLLAGAGTAALVYFGGVRALEGQVSAGSWFLFIQGIGLFWFPLTSIASFWSQFQIGLAAAERVFALIDAEPKVVQLDHRTLPDMRGEIRFENVDFKYKDDEPVLENFSLTINAGETLALVGHTGSGKSSIGKLIARFYEFQGGKILIDGQDIRTLDLQDYRRQLGIVTQTPFLFDGNVMDNIRYPKPDAPDGAVKRVARMVGGGDWIASLPDGLMTEVGERGGSLSMGQRQLAALARALLEDPAIFILDEATASVDPLTEAMIQEGLDVTLKDRTSVVIAHRLSTIKNADRIIVLRQGKIIETGTHETLLAQGGHYAELYTTYFRHQSLEYIEGMGEAAR